MTKETATPPVVAVVGAGVSGCAAALALAERGVRVVLISSSLDTLGLPGYGPAVDHAPLPPVRPSRLAEALRGVAAPLADAWLAHAWEPAEDLAVGLVDRRGVSLSVKWRVENEGLVDIRQGIVTGIEECTTRSTMPGGGIVALTAFGERILADAAVVAVGLALGGRVEVDGAVSVGGRLGEVGSDALLEDLRSRGAPFEQVRVAVGARVRAVEGTASSGTDGVPLRPGFVDPGVSGLRQVDFAPAGGNGDGGTWSLEGREGFVPPPSPYERPPEGIAALAREAFPAGDDLAWHGLVLMPDGVVTGEWYVSPAVEADLPVGNLLGSRISVSRPAHVISGFVASSGEGQLLPGVWVAGQAAGAQGYLESLAGGWRVGSTVASRLLRGES